MHTPMVLSGVVLLALIHDAVGIQLSSAVLLFDNLDLV